MSTKVYSTDGLNARPRKRIYTNERMIRIYVKLGDDKKMAISKTKFKMNMINQLANLKYSQWT
jgi:hypothetical protein